MTDDSVRKSIRVRTSVEHAFRVFTDGMDTWWPREHHIGDAPLKRVLIEGRAGGRCYSEQTDGTECDWGQVLVWDPPHRFVFAWQVNALWKYESDLAKSSEVEVRFLPEPDGTTLVELEHRHFERLGAGGDAMRMEVGAPEGWGKMLTLFGARTELAREGSAS